MGNKKQVKKVICQFCHSRCRILLHSENDHLLKIEADRAAPRAGTTVPTTEGCLRLRGTKEFMYHPDRVNFPLKRVGEKGEGKWQRISWDQAFDEIAEKLKRIKEKYGAEAIASTNGTGRNIMEFTTRFLHALGTPNLNGGVNICYGPYISMAIAMFGWTVGHRRFVSFGGDKQGTGCSLLVGIDPSESTPPLWKSCLEAGKRGIKLIVIDPRRTRTAELADIWLQLRPATDTALLMSMINVIIEEGLYDKEFVDKWCYGFEQVAERAREYVPEKAAEICWVPAEKIREAARMYATNKPAFGVHGMGIEHLSNGIQAIQARYILTAITGNLDVEGGEGMPGPSRLVPGAEIELSHLLSAEQKKKQLGSDRFRLMSWQGRDLIQPYVKKVWGQECSLAWVTAIGHAPTVYRAMLTGKPYPVKATITIASNPMVTPANTKLVYKALKSLDLYVVADYWLTPSAQLADYVLPTASWMERPYLYDVFNTDFRILGGERGLPSTIPGEYERKDDYEICRGLGIRLGQEEYWPWEKMEQAFDYRLKPLGMTFKEFMDKGGFYYPAVEYRKYEKQGFGTPTGKAEIYSTVLEKLGYDPLPRYEESHENPLSMPKLKDDYPLMLISGGRFHPMYHSEHRQIDSIRKKHPHPLVQINPETAKKLGIQDGDWVWIESPRGRIRMKATLFSGIDTRVVHAEHGWWFPELPNEEPWLGGVWESNVNVLTDDDPEVCNQICGIWPLKTALCRVYKAKVY